MVNWLRNTVDAVTGTDKDDFVPDPKTATPDAERVREAPFG